MPSERERERERAVACEGCSRGLMSESGQIEEHKQVRAGTDTS